MEAVSENGEVIFDGKVETFVGHRTRQTMVRAVIPDLQQKIARLARTERPPIRNKVAFDQAVHDVGQKLEAHSWGQDPEDFCELLAIRIRHLNLVRNSAEKRSVDQVLLGSRFVEKMMSWSKGT